MRVLCLVVVFYYLINSTNADGEPVERALIFNRKKNPSLIYIPEPEDENDVFEIKCGSWVSACPAATEDEDKFNKDYSFYNAALFVKNRYSEQDSCADLQKDRCEKLYKLSMAWFKETIEFGYEIYFERSKLADSKFDIDDASIYDDYEPLKTFLELESKSITDRIRSLYAMRKNRPTKTALKLKEKDMEFIWIPLIKVWIKMNRIRKVEYQIRTENVVSNLDCKDYSLGKELFYDADIDARYTKENQEKRLQGMKLPSKEEKNGCEDGFNCLTKWLLVPSDQFEFATTPFSTPQCSNIVTVPIWKSTLEKILEKLDIYLYTLTRVSGDPLRIVAGVKGILALPRNMGILPLPRTGLGGWFFSSHVSLEEGKFTMRSPAIIYKIVKINTTKCNTSEKACWFGVLIVIHNGPYFDVSNKICPDVSEEWGWYEIKYEDFDFSQKSTPSEHIYACKITEDSIKAVGLTYRPDFIGDLSLKHYPVYENGEVRYIDMGKLVEDELVRMNGSNESIKVEKKIVERPPIYDEDFDVQNDADDSAAEKDKEEAEEQEKKDK